MKDEQKLTFPGVFLGVLESVIIVKQTRVVQQLSVQCCVWILQQGWKASQLVNKPFQGFWRHLAKGANTANITVNEWGKWNVQCLTTHRKFELWSIHYELKIKRTSFSICLSVKPSRNSRENLDTFASKIKLIAIPGLTSNPCSQIWLFLATHKIFRTLITLNSLDIRVLKFLIHLSCLPPS